MSPSVSELRITDPLDPRLELASGYSPTFRKVETASVAVYFAITLFALYQLGYSVAENPITFLVFFFLGYLGADLFSGAVHWFCDTWGTVKWPILGPTLIRSFREHHVNAETITHHDFIEVNGTCCLACIPIVGASFLSIPFGAQVFLVSLTIWVVGTNEFHKWSHRKTNSNLVRFLQKWRIILDSESHEIHHTNPYSRYYCITNGRMNPILDRTRFWRILETFISKLTGWIPREDDQKWVSRCRAYQDQKKERALGASGLNGSPTVF